MYQYSVTIQYDDTDKIYVASVPELDGYMAHSDTQEQAIKEIQVTIRGWLKVAEEHGYTIPEPKMQYYWNIYFSKINSTSDIKTVIVEYV